MLGMSHFSEVWVCKHFLPNVGQVGQVKSYLFIYLTGSFTEQKFYILIHSFFPFTGHAFGVSVRTLCLC